MISGFSNSAELQPANNLHRSRCRWYLSHCHDFACPKGNLVSVKQVDKKKEESLSLSKTKNQSKCVRETAWNVHSLSINLCRTKLGNLMRQLIWITIKKNKTSSCIFRRKSEFITIKLLAETTICWQTKCWYYRFNQTADMLSSLNSVER